jgi:acyl-coenzyme A synthetase/AMP-(fatty) acid ligase
MRSLPLFAHLQPDSIVAYRGGRSISARRFLRDVHELAGRLPARGAHVLNLCADRYRFTVGLAAALLSGRTSLLPPTHTPEVIRHLCSFAPDAFCLTDDPECTLELPLLFYREPGAEPSGAPAFEVPRVPASRTVAIIFTSGSTGTPVAHRKSWGRLARCVGIESSRLSLPNRSAAVLATVPAQHMYGFESSVLLPLLNGHALCAERPFFPADIATSLQRLPRPRVLVTTPVHLRALLAAETVLPALDLIVSATSMLAINMAREVERCYGAPLLEIYGSTETGQIAQRRTALEDTWHLWNGVRLEYIGERWWARGGHIEEPTAVSDVLEMRGAGQFLLHGRLADMVNIAGKRSSIGYLNHQLNAIPGVIDGAYFVREDSATTLAGVTRLAALVVAPGMDSSAILQALRERIDPVFLPRPLLLVDALPRNDTGKLPHHELRSLVAQAAARTPDLFA